MTVAGCSAPLEVKGLVKSFGSFRALDGIDLRVARGEVHGFLGPNGAGKSTTLRIVMGLYHRTAGWVRVQGFDPGLEPAAATRRVSYVPGDVQLWPSLTGQEVLDALAGLRGAYDTAAERDLLQAFALDPSRRVRTYSKGNRQKVVLVAAFAARTDLLILDEPTSGLDPLMAEVFAEQVRSAAAAGRTVLLSSHVLTEVEQLCEAVTIIKDGRVVETGRVTEMRHLASSSITATVPDEARPWLQAGLGSLGIETPAQTGHSGQRLTLRVAGAAVNDALGLLLAVSATSITCEPATLEDLFLRHYEVLAR